MLGRGDQIFLLFTDEQESGDIDPKERILQHLVAKKDKV